MFYFRRKNKAPIYLCPQCGADIHIPQELYKTILKKYNKEKKQRKLQIVDTTLSTLN